MMPVSNRSCPQSLLPTKRQTASVYLKTLESIGELKEMKVGREKLFIHPNFVHLLTNDDHTVPTYSVAPTATQA
jgi:hypothetical protein